MNLFQLNEGTQVLLSDGSTAKVVAPTQDGKSVRVRYEDSPFKPELVGTETDCTEDEVVSVEGPKSLWGERNGRAHNFVPGSSEPADP